MDQRLSRQVVIDEGGFGANAPEGPPDEDEGFRVLEVHGDDFLRLDAMLGAQPGAVSQSFVVDVTVGVCLAFKDEEGLGSGRRRLCI